MRKKLPIGIDGFEIIRTNDFYYADKTMFIKELLQNWGESDLALFDGLNNMQEKELCEKYMGKFPVISISLKSVDGRSFESASAALRTIIGGEGLTRRGVHDDGESGYSQSENPFSASVQTLWPEGHPVAR